MPDYGRVSVTLPVVSPSITVDRYGNVYGGIGTGGILPSASGQMCIGWMDGYSNKVPPEKDIIDFHTGIGGQINYGQWGVGYRQSWTTGKRSSSEITFGGRQLPSGSFGYSWKAD